MISIAPTYLLYFLPLLVAISCVFGATRHEDTGLMIGHALATARWIASFMVVIFAILWIIDWTTR